MKQWEQPRLTLWNVAEDYIINEPHVLIGGTTGSGKSVLMNDILHTISAHHPVNRQIYIIDLKMVEYIDWDIPHIKAVVDEPNQVLPLLNYIDRIMMSRYETMKREHQKTTKCCDIYVIIDELTEVLTIPGVREKLDHLMRLARAAKIHIIGATQNVSRGKGGVPSELQKNFSCCIGLRCKSAIESKQIIGIPGCESLPRYGQAYLTNADGLFRITIPYMSDEEVAKRNKAYAGYFE